MLARANRRRWTVAAVGAVTVATIFPPGWAGPAAADAGPGLSLTPPEPKPGRR